jgi:hypothetical protein
MGCLEEVGSDGADGAPVEAILIPSADGSPGGRAGGGPTGLVLMAQVPHTAVHILQGRDRPTTGLPGAIPGDGAARGKATSES